jgi:hypothetical protein
MKKTITNKMAKLLFQTATAGLMLCASLTHAGLATVNNGAGNISLTGASDSNPDAIGGPGYLAMTTAQFFSYDNSVDGGDVYSYVYGVGVDPLNTLGGYTFVYAITNGFLSNPSLGISQVQIGSSSWGSTVELGYSTSTVVDPATGSLNLGSTVTFNWSPPSTGIVGNYYLVVCTAEQNYGLTTAFVGDDNGDDSNNLSVLGPVAAPEPSTLALLLLPLGFVTFRVFRKAPAA